MKNHLMAYEAWAAVVLAASRGPDDPIAKHYGLMHKCELTLNGKSMLGRVISALSQLDKVVVSIEDSAVLERSLAKNQIHTHMIKPSHSAPASAITAIGMLNTFPILITTGDHALLTKAMVAYVIDSASNENADMTVSLATRETIEASYPATKRTYFRLQDCSVSGCNLFTVHRPAGLRLLEMWSMLEKDRKKPWKLAAAFGVTPLIKFICGRLTLDAAFVAVSAKCGASVRPLLLPFAEAAIDVDKPADKDLAETILQAREE
jgi:GTP:adenosylcobinamide-phosphate guanylyltransferase